MGCINDTINLREDFYDRLREKVYTERIPINGSIELTSRCNFECVHCYNKNSGEDKKELSAAEWKAIIDQLTEAGTLYLLVSGGEPLSRPDFIEIYEYAIKKGMIVSLFTNGLLINDRIIKVLKKYPPRNVEITLYGASEEVYHKVTGKKDVFDKCLSNIKKLVENKIPTQLKTIFLKSNIEEFEKIKKIASDLGVNYRCDGAVIPRLDGSTEPLEHRLTPEQVVTLNCSSEELVEEWIKLVDDDQNQTMTDNVYSCGAALSSYHIDAEGWLYPCLMVNDIKYSLKDGSFQDGWQNALPAIWEKKLRADHKCKKCSNQALCNYCPASFRLENGSENEVSQFLCDIGMLMSKKLKNIKHERE